MPLAPEAAAEASVASSPAAGTPNMDVASRQGRTVEHDHDVPAVATGSPASPGRTKDAGASWEALAHALEASARQVEREVEVARYRDWEAQSVHLHQQHSLGRDVVIGAPGAGVGPFLSSSRHHRFDHHRTATSVASSAATSVGGGLGGSFAEFSHAVRTAHGRLAPL